MSTYISSNRLRTAGFSLVELMVAVAIGAIMVTGLIQIFLANRQSYRVMESANFMQENLRFAIDRVATSVRMADHFGSLRGRKVLNPGSGAPCTSGWARNTTEGIWGLDGSPGVPSGASTCLTVSNYQPNTDILMVRYAGPEPIPVTQTLASGQWYTVTTTGGGDPTAMLYLGSAVPTPAPQAEMQTFRMQYNAELFWVRKCSDPGNDNNCGTGDDGDRPDPIPTLMRSYLDQSGTWTSEPLAEGMEQFQVEYQIMNRGWMSATQVAALPAGRIPQWNRITGVRLAGVMRSAEKDTRFPADTRTFNLSGDTPSYVAPTTQAQYLRTAYEANAVIRARVRPSPAI